MRATRGWKAVYTPALLSEDCVVIAEYDDSYDIVYESVFEHFQNVPPGQIRFVTRGGERVSMTRGVFFGKWKEARQCD